MVDNGTHPGGNKDYWQDDTVKKYEYQQAITSEKKAERLSLRSFEAVISPLKRKLIVRL